MEKLRWRTRIEASVPGAVWTYSIELCNRKYRAMIIDFDGPSGSIGEFNSLNAAKRAVAKNYKKWMNSRNNV